MLSVSLCASFEMLQALYAGLLCQWIRYGATLNPLVSEALPDQESGSFTFFNVKQSSIVTCKDFM